MRRSTALVLAVAAVVISLVGVGGGSASAATDDRLAEHRRIGASWTAAERARAIDRDVVLRGGPKPLAKPGTGGGGTTTGTVTGATWSPMSAPVAKTTGKIFFREDGVGYTCSGSAVSAGSLNVVLTAGHCVHGGGASGEFVTDFTFYPQYGLNPSNPPYGYWTATDLFTTDAWVDGSSTNGATSKWNDDVGFGVMFKTGNVSIATALGVPLPSVSIMNVGTNKQSAFGYPAAKKYSGRVLTWCQGTTNLGYDTNDTYGMACNMTGGSSGGPWLTNMNSDGSGGTITSLNSYGYSSLANVMFGPIFDTDEGATLADATADGACDGDESVPCISHSD